MAQALFDAIAAVKAAETAVALAQTNLKRTQISLPFRGRVQSQSAGLGQFVSPGKVLGTAFGTDVAEVHTAGSHSRLRSQRMMAFGTPYHHTSQAISPAPPLRQLAGKTMLLVLQLLRRKPHGGAGAMVFNVECALHLLSGGPHSCQYTGRPLCKRS